MDPISFMGRGVLPIHDLVRGRGLECNPQPLTCPMSIPSWTTLNTEREHSADWVSLATNDAWVLSYEVHQYSNSAIAYHISLPVSGWLTLSNHLSHTVCIKTGRFPGFNRSSRSCLLYRLKRGCNVLDTYGLSTYQES
jgi:hypothetical protein